MSENQESQHQDPAEQYQVDTAVETEPQADSVEEETPDEDPEPVEVAPVDPAVTETAVEEKTHFSSGQTYSVTPDRGYRVKND